MCPGIIRHIAKIRSGPEFVPERRDDQDLKATWRLRHEGSVRRVLTEDHVGYEGEKKTAQKLGQHIFVAVLD